MNRPPPIPAGNRRARRVALLILGTALLPILAAIVWHTSYRLSTSAAIRRLEAKVRANGQPLNLRDLEASLPKVLDEQNAALPLLDLWSEEAADHWNAFRNKLRSLPERRARDLDPALPFLGTQAKRLARAAPLSDESRAAAVAYITAQQYHLQRVRQVLERPHFRFTLELGLGYDMLVPHLAEIRHEANIFRLAGLTAFENGNVRGALRALENNMRLAGLLSEEPLLISQLIRLACASMVLDDLQRILSRQQLSDDQLSQIEPLLQRINGKGALRSALLSERATSLSVFEGAGFAPQALTAGAEDTNGIDAEGFKAGMRFFAAIGLAGPDKKLMLETFERAITLTEQDSPEALMKYEQVFSNLDAEVREFPPKIFCGLLLPPLAKAGTRFAAFDARRRAGLMAIAVERYRNSHGGALPKKLEDLAPGFAPGLLLDPFDGQPLRFQSYANRTIRPENGETAPMAGYVIYSIGEDRTDDHGKEQRPGKQDRNFDQTFIVE